MSRLTELIKYYQQSVKYLAKSWDVTTRHMEMGEIRQHREHCQIEDDTLTFLIELQKYKDLEEQGKLVLFPSYAYFIKDKKVHEGWVQEVMYWHNRKPLYDIRYDDNSLANYRGYLGLTVFLTKEEAEAKLKELQGK